MFWRPLNNDESLGPYVAPPLIERFGGLVGMVKRIAVDNVRLLADLQRLMEVLNQHVFVAQADIGSPRFAMQKVSERPNFGTIARSMAHYEVRVASLLDKTSDTF
jgi:hypothetical protein